jgi:hypothetical protein
LEDDDVELAARMDEDATYRMTLIAAAWREAGLPPPQWTVVDEGRVTDPNLQTPQLYLNPR